MGGARRDSLALLRALLDALLELGSASKTRLVSITGLNPYSFEKYIAAAMRSGSATTRQAGERLYYHPTFRTALTSWALAITSSIIEPPLEALERYNRVLRELNSRLGSKGIRLRGCIPRGSCEIPSDALIECQGATYKLYISVGGDPLNYIRVLAMLESLLRGERVLLLLEPSPDNRGIVSISRLLGVEYFTTIDSLLDRLAAECSGG